jgi:hypothetical protein
MKQYPVNAKYGYRENEGPGANEKNPAAKV